MLIKLKGVLDERTLAQIREKLSVAHFVDGKLTAGSDAQKVKKNLELRQNNDLVGEIHQLVLGALKNSNEFWWATRFKAMLPPLIAKYEPGMFYGSHLDNAVMGGDDLRIRTDVSITVFLNGPGDYDGGELTLDNGFEVMKVKGNAGDAVTYPSTFYHHVAPVTRGQRLVFVNWIQSAVSDVRKRKILYDLAILARHLRKKGQGPESTELKLTELCHQNLIRMWSQM
ncbi:MAG: Fe2+-dependent dioxygenase [Planctomycetaceae bacterium]|nr:Fe2+-dependent dioxygenase [Planctomycetaceae bacterium]MBP62889.1 Fe2+-dependent dioxygenase [Planctomycetaceae bacterium]